MASRGLKVLRFNSHDVLADKEAVVEIIYRSILNQRETTIPSDPPLIKGGSTERGPEIQR